MHAVPLTAMQPHAAPLCPDLPRGGREEQCERQGHEVANALRLEAHRGEPGREQHAGLAGAGLWGGIWLGDWWPRGAFVACKGMALSLNTPPPTQLRLGKAFRQITAAFPVTGSN